MTPAISVNAADLKKLAGRMRDIERKQIPFAASLALNATGEDVMGSNQNLMRRVFDRPTRWTLNAFYLKRSTKTDLNASVQRKTAVGRRFYLEVQSDGGGRKKSGIESLFSARLEGGDNIDAVVPTRAVRKNRYGNVSPAQMKRILSGVKVQSASTAGAGGKAGAGRARYFASKPGGKLSPGVFERKGRKIKKVLAFTDEAPRYRSIFPMERNGYAVAGKVLAGHMRRSIKRALASAR